MVVGKEGESSVVGNAGVATPVAGGVPQIKPWCTSLYWNAWKHKHQSQYFELVKYSGLLVGHPFARANPGVSLACRLVD